MSAFRKAPLRIVDAPNGWVVYQKSGNQISAAWSMAAAGTALSKVKGADAQSLVDQARAARMLVMEAPAHWVALPTGLDLQVHLRHPGQPQKETLRGGLESALYGGFDSIVTMPNTNPFLEDPATLAAAAETLRREASDIPVRVGFAASATRGMQGQDACDIGALARAGAVAITDDGWGVKSEKAQADIFAACADHDLLFQQHAEMPGHRGVATASAFQRTQNLPEYPRSAESAMIARDVAILRRFPKARYHVLHVSTRESLDEIRRAKGEGLRVTAEVTPHHLYFSNADIPEGPLSTNYKMNPPLFAPEDRAALREALRDGTIDCVSTDHAPHEANLKGQGWTLSPFGTRGLETALSTLTTLVHEGALSWSRLEEVFSSAPRRVLGRAEFAQATGLLWVDPKAKLAVQESDLPGISLNSCFLGATLHGRIELRAERGRLYYRSGTSATA